jgi:hypothetical protein
MHSVVFLPNPQRGGSQRGSRFGLMDDGGVGADHVHGHEKLSMLHYGGGGPWWRGGFLICENIRGKR